MIQVTYRLKLGQDEFEIKADVKDEKEFFEVMSFYSTLPKVAPGGSSDLKLVFRTTKEGHKYYSLISESEKMEFKLGQNLDKNGGGLFPKGWSPAYQSETSDQFQNVSSAPSIRPPVTQQKSGFKIPGNPLPPPPTYTPPTPAISNQVASPVPAPASPNIQATANNVLARFGIPTK